MYNPQEIESKWIKYWDENKTFKTENDFSKPKWYSLDMFPYPSGAGLHVGHPKGYTANDIVARYKKAKGFNVLHPIGWDAFGLPAENYAIKTGTHPRETTDKNIQTFKRQIKELGFSYDWDREIDTTDPKYYKWTQWIFLKMFEHGLAYEQDMPINYCPSCKTGLANEEVLNNFTCERCGTKVEKKRLRQWVLAITKYADRLANDVDKLDWPEGIKEMQKNWIGRSEGCEFEMKLAGDETKSIGVYTTRVDTVFGMTYAVVAPDHKDVNDFITDSEKAKCEAYIDEANGKSDLDRTELAKEKTGVFTGSYVINPFNGKEVPLWIGDYVLGSYGTGAVMAVPAHDERDFEFAKTFGLDINTSVKSKNEDSIYPGMSCETDKIKEIKNNYKFEVRNVPNEKNKFFILGDIENILEIKEKYGVRILGHSDLPKEDRALVTLGVNPWIYTQDGVLVNSGEFTGKTSAEARKALITYAEEKEFGKLKVNFKLRDWLFSRQRYWGEPIPLIHLDFDQIKNLEHINKLEDATDNNKAYILKTEATEGADERTLCPGSNMQRKLVINGEVFSKIYDGINGKMVCDYRLPLELPEVENFEPAGDGNSPLATVDDFVNIKLADNLTGKRETNTMPQWGGSCWYYLRYMDNLNNDDLVAPEVANYWGEIDSYVGGAEHAVLHLLYARFWHKFLFDIGVVPTDEPFYRLRNQGLILGMGYFTKDGGVIANDLVETRDDKFFHKETGEELTEAPTKMSKSLKNVVNPDDIINEFSADTLRMYEMYLADFKDAAPWDTKAITGVKRFLDRVWNNVTGEQAKTASSDEEAMKAMHKTIKKVGEDIEHYKFNTAISAMMIMLNTGLPKDEALAQTWKENLVTILSCFAPFISEELWEKLGHDTSVFFAKWPEYDESALVENTVTLGVSINGKVRDQISLPKDIAKDEAIALAKETEGAKKWIEGKEIIKEIYVPGKLINIVVKG